MKSTDIPSRFTVPFANAAGGSYVRTIPVASQIGIQNGAASLTDGFPPLNFIPVGAGGVPPFGQDFNGILKQITQWSQWQGAGSATTYDAAFSTAIGGYPQGAIVSGSNAGVVWLSTDDDNTSNPNSGGSGWVQIASSADVQSGRWNYAVAGGTANALTASLDPAPSSLTNGMIINVLIVTTNTSTSSLNVNGLGADVIVGQDGSLLTQGVMVAGSVATFVRGTSSWVLVGFSAGQSIPRSTVIFSSTGLTNWTVPTGIYRVRARVWGGGGGSGGAYNGGNSGGGGGGGYAEGIYSVTPGQVIAVTVGVGGTAGNATTTPTAGGTGGTSSFGAFCTANAGTGGAASNGSGVSSQGGNGGAASGGNVLNVNGGASSGGLFGVGAGGGNGGASFGIPGNPAGGFGAPGLNGPVRGGGAGGTGAAATGANYTGGAGGRGEVIIEF